MITKADNIIHWQGDDWIIKQCRGYWSLCRPAVTVSWYLPFQDTEKFLEFLRKEAMNHEVPGRVKNSLVHKKTFKIICIYCRKKPSEIEEYIEMAKIGGITPDMAVQQEEGTYNPKNGHFCCTDCYIKIGMPATPPGAGKGWIAP